MGTFQVPQFIDIEDKIIGPLSLRQFLILVGTAALAFLSFKVLQIWLWIIVGGLIGALGLALAFLKINGQNFSRVAVNFLRYMIHPRLYVWQRSGTNKVLIKQQPKIIKKEVVEKKRLSSDELGEMAKKLDE
ncbi:MAG TPA: PrgI family protein [Candidatus Paceibacterota bacterium]|nr:PrgI family protein [Candidatus Paceibacterota bacterium]HPT40422.1 PrgI family protein [Candidatus Paceibacterota bacterium]